jgi:hypothetical protein
MLQLPLAALQPPRTASRLDAAFQVDRRNDRRVMAALRLMVIAVVVLQRFAVPGIGTALCLPIVIAVLVYLVREGAVVLDSIRTWLYLLGIGACCAAAVLSTTYLKDDWSLNSVALLIVLYCPFCLRLRPGLTNLYRPVLEFFNRIMVLAAGVALAQWIAQIAGWTYRDLLDFLPDQLLLQNYNTSYPVRYGSLIMKSNAVVFLEPSFCSQFLAVALIVQLLLGGRRWRLPLYAAALLATVAGTGILLVGVGLVVLALGRRPAWAARALVLLLLVGGVVQSTPLGEILAGRSSEATQQNTSGQARFVAPYVLVATGLAEDTTTLVIGRGPGIVSRTTGAEFFNRERVGANYPAIPKLAAEYGLIAAILFCSFVVVAMVRRTPSITISAMMLAVYFLLSGSLLQPHTVLFAYLLISLFATRSGPVLNEIGWTNERPLPMTTQPASHGDNPMPSGYAGDAN